MKKRPVNLNLFTIRFPITAWVSILHRLSGVFVFLFIPLFLWMLQESLASFDRYNALKSTLSHPVIKSFIWLLLVALFYHLLAGLRHLLLDIHWGETKKVAKYGSYGLLSITFIISICLGYWLW